VEVIMQSEKSITAKHLSSSESAAPAMAAEAGIADYKVATRDQRANQERAVFSGLLARSRQLSDMEVVNLVRDGLPVNVIELFIREGVTQQEVYGLVAPRRTLDHRRARSEPLSPVESDRAVRLARVVAQAESVFDNKEKAMTWLRRPMRRFEGHSPIQMLESDAGSRLVEEALVQIDEGYFA